MQIFQVALWWTLLILFGLAGLLYEHGRKTGCCCNREEADEMLRLSQREKLRLFFIERVGEWVPLYQIMEIGKAQYNARIFELRRSGMIIEHRHEMVDGVCHSYYRFVKEMKELQRTFC